MNDDRWTDRLSEYLDGELDLAERLALEEHLGSCASCRATLAELEVLVRSAAALPAPDPARDLWPGIQAALRSEGTPVTPFPGSAARRSGISLPRLAAAAVAVLALGGTGLWMAAQGGGAGDPGPVALETDRSVSLAAVPAVAEGDYAPALRRLERSVAERRDELDPATIRVIEESMAIIDAALVDAEAALEQDPASTYLNRHYDATMRKKIELLRRAANAERAVS